MTKAQSESVMLKLARELVGVADSFEMAKAYAKWAVTVGHFASARLTWPDGTTGTPLRSERLGRPVPAAQTRAFSIRLRDQGSVFFRVELFGGGTRQPSRELARTLRAAARLVERAVEKNELRLQQEELNRFNWIRQFSAGISHELNTPLTTFLFYARKMARETRDEALNEPMRKSVAAVTSVLSQYRQLTGDGEFLEFETTPTADLGRRLEAYLRGQFDATVDALSFEDATRPGAVSVRVPDIERLLLAVVKNAFDALRRITDPAHRARVHVQFKTSATHYRVIITDNGPGIAPENRAFIFAPFFTTKEFNEGLGLGLSLARAIAFMHDGSLRLNPLSRQTQFILQIPLVKAHALKEVA